jgi:hypothetical protein
LTSSLSLEEFSLSGLSSGWTLGGAVQETMDIYVTAATFKEIERVSSNPLGTLFMGIF